MKSTYLFVVAYMVVDLDLQVIAVAEAEQLDGVSLDAVSPIPPSPSTSTGLSSQTEASSQVEDVTRNPSQANPLPVSPLQVHKWWCM